MLNFLRSASQLLVTSILALPDFAEDARLYEHWFDASGFGVGARLVQGGTVVTYESRSFTAAECFYGVGEQELVVIVHSLTVWQCRLKGCAQ